MLSAERIQGAQMEEQPDTVQTLAWANLQKDTMMMLNSEKKQLSPERLVAAKKKLFPCFKKKNKFMKI